MKFDKGDIVKIKDLRDNHSVPDGMKMFSGQTGKITAVYASEDTLNTYYTLTADNEQGVWSETLLTKSEDEDLEYIDTVIKLLRDVETNVETIKRLLWRKKHLND